MNPLRTRFVQIGNSRGLRIPKPIIEQLGLGGEVEISVERDRLVIKAAAKPREGWEEEFQAMAKRGDDAVLMPDTTSEWDESEWEW